eukprot:SAG31_NODE_518_length_14674_cov_39.604803_1_plen_96_part_00
MYCHESRRRSNAAVSLPIPSRGSRCDVLSSRDDFIVIISSRIVLVSVPKYLDVAAAVAAQVHPWMHMSGCKLTLVLRCLEGREDAVRVERDGKQR